MLSSRNFKKNRESLSFELYIFFFSLNFNKILTDWFRDKSYIYIIRVKFALNARNTREFSRKSGY